MVFSLHAEKGKWMQVEPQDMAWICPHVIELYWKLNERRGSMDMFAEKVMERKEEYFTKANFEAQTYSTPRRKKRKSSNHMKKRRFSDEQIRSLESIFYSSDSKLDPGKKMQLATELGLQPRQVAIWFQNRRARGKFKQMENDFLSLRANYDNLASQFKSLQEEKNSLLSQLQKLCKLLQERPHDIGNTTFETRAIPKMSQEESEQRGIVYLNNYKTDKNWVENGEGDQGLKLTHPLEERSFDIGDTEEQGWQLLNPNGPSDSAEKWCDFDSDGAVIFEYQPCSSSSQWLNLWE